MSAATAKKWDRETYTASPSMPSPGQAGSVLGAVEWVRIYVGTLGAFRYEGRTSFGHSFVVWPERAVVRIAGGRGGATGHKGIVYTPEPRWHVAANGLRWDDTFGCSVEARCAAEQAVA